MIVSVEFTLPRAPQVERYLRFNGWSRQIPGELGSLWTRGDDELGFPHRIDNEDIQAMLRRLALIEDRQPRFIAEAARFLQVDVTMLRVVPIRGEIETVPLSTISTALTAIYRMLRAAASATVARKGSIGGRQPARATKLVRDIQVDYPERGTFVVPILVPLSGPPAQSALDGLEADEYIPYERRAIMTLEEGLQALNQKVIQPENEPNDTELDDLVDAGVSSELCGSLSALLEDTEAEEFEATVEWAPTVSPRELAPRRITLPGEASKVIRRTARRLKLRHETRQSRFTGLVVSLDRRPDEPDGLIGILTYVEGRERVLLARLPDEEYQLAGEHHQARSMVVVEGVVEVRSDRKLYIPEPRYFGQAGRSSDI